MIRLNRYLPFDEDAEFEDTVVIDLQSCSTPGCRALVIRGKCQQCKLNDSADSFYKQLAASDAQRDIEAMEVVNG